MEERKVYEFVTVKGYFHTLDSGSRLYYDLKRGVYVFHTENDWANANENYRSFEHTIKDVIVPINVVERGIESGELTPGPVLGELTVEKPTKKEVIKSAPAKPVVKKESLTNRTIHNKFDTIYKRVQEINDLVDDIYLELDDRFRF